MFVLHTTMSDQLWNLQPLTLNLPNTPALVCTYGVKFPSDIKKENIALFPHCNTLYWSVNILPCSKLSTSWWPGLVPTWRWLRDCSTFSCSTSTAQRLTGWCRAPASRILSADTLADTHPMSGSEWLIESSNTCTVKPVNQETCNYGHLHNPHT